MPTLEATTDYTRPAGSWRALLKLEEIAEHPALQVVIFGLDLAPGACGDGLVVAGQQHPRALAEHASAWGLRPGLQPHRHPQAAGVDDACCLELHGRGWRGGRRRRLGRRGRWPAWRGCRGGRGRRWVGGDDAWGDRR